MKPYFEVAENIMTGKTKLEYTCRGKHLNNIIRGTNTLIFFTDYPNLESYGE